jgi:hypothetical protein
VQQHEGPRLHTHSLCDWPSTEASEHDRKVGALLGLDPARIAENRRQAEEESRARGTQPPSKERLKELTAFSAEVSDEEFERYMAYINAGRGRAS